MQNDHIFFALVDPFSPSSPRIFALFRDDYIVGEPIDLPYGPEAAEDEDIVAELHQRVTEATQQQLIDRCLAHRDQAA